MKDYINKKQQGGLLDLDKLRAKLNVAPTTQQDKVPSKKVIQSATPVLKNYLTGNDVTEQDRKNQVPGTPMGGAPYQGTIHTPYKTSLREDAIRGLDKLDRNGDNAVIGGFTSIPKSALNLLRPDKYFDGVRNDDGVANAFSNMGGDVLNASPLVEMASPLLRGTRSVAPVLRNDGVLVHTMMDESKPALTNKLRDRATALMDKQWIPGGQKKVLPDNVSIQQSSVPSTTIPGKKIYTTALVGDDGNTYGSLRGFTDNAKQWMDVGMINVKPELQGNKLQDVLYHKAAQQAQIDGMQGVRSGTSLLAPGATAKMQQRFNRVVMDINNTDGIDHEVAGLTFHQNPNVVEDWMARYKEIPKTQPQKFSVNDLLNKLNPPKRVNQSGLQVL